MHTGFDLFGTANPGGLPCVTFCMKEQIIATLYRLEMILGKLKNMSVIPSPR